MTTTLQLRKTKQRYAGCPILTKTVAAIGEVDPTYEGWLELAQRLALSASKGQRFAPEERAIECIRFGVVDCIRFMAQAADWTCPPLERARNIRVHSEDDINRLAYCMSEANVLFIRHQEANRTKVQGGTEATPEWLLAEQIRSACVTAGGSIQFDLDTLSQLGVGEMLFSFLGVAAARRDRKAERTALRKIRQGFIGLLERLSA
jgi:hypothetical protein